MLLGENLSYYIILWDYLRIDEVFEFLGNVNYLWFCLVNSSLRCSLIVDKI